MRFGSIEDPHVAAQTAVAQQVAAADAAARRR